MNKLIQILLFASVMCVGNAYGATAVARSGNDSVTISDTPCVSEKAISALPRAIAITRLPLKPSHLGQATVLVDGRVIPACWVLIGDNVLILDADNDETSIYPIPAAAFVAPAAI